MLLCASLWSVGMMDYSVGMNECTLVGLTVNL